MTGVRLLVVIAAATLAGCLGGPSAETAEGPLQVEPGTLLGVVVDPAVRPIAGATVHIPTRPEVPAVQTSDDGTFRFSGLVPGAVYLQVTKEGFLPASAAATVRQGAASPFVQVQLAPLEETRPYAVLESFRGHIECGVGSAPVFGLSLGCMVTAGSALYIACIGSDPIPPAGVCVGGTNPYFVSTAAGNMSAAQTEVVWDPTVAGMSELLIGSYVVDREGTVVGGAPGVSGPSVLVRRLGPDVVHELQLGGAHSLALFVNPGNSATANLVVQQSYDIYHTSTFFFEPDPAWVFALDGPVPVPDACQACRMA